MAQPLRMVQLNKIIQLIKVAYPDERVYLVKKDQSI